MIVTPFSSAEHGIAREAALLRDGRPALLLWQAEEPALVLPAALARRQDVRPARARAARAGWPTARRGSGGGIVPQGPSTLNLAMISPVAQGFTLEDGYNMICGALIEALSRFDITASTGSKPDAFCDGAWNILAEGRKLAGTAQRWRATPQGPILLAHAAVLIHRPESTLWPTLRDLSDAAFSDQPPIDADAHVALADLLPGRMNPDAFSGAVLRAAEERLVALGAREKDAA
ncbi:MAG: hypothetical protein D6754_06635 [Alphaproteobacteria bacterium]|nr:MAG: hypothetical protein D6754_06635 [Alphaproteobacteria bacterium]